MFSGNVPVFLKLTLEKVLIYCPQILHLPFTSSDRLSFFRRSSDFWVFCSKDSRVIGLIVTPLVRSFLPILVLKQFWNFLNRFWKKCFQQLVTSGSHQMSFLFNIDAFLGLFYNSFCSGIFKIAYVSQFIH